MVAGDERTNDTNAIVGQLSQDIGENRDLMDKHTSSSDADFHGFDENELKVASQYLSQYK